jgi:hypothetical protein
MNHAEIDALEARWVAWQKSAGWWDRLRVKVGQSGLKLAARMALSALWVTRDDPDPGEVIVELREQAEFLRGTVAADDLAAFSIAELRRRADSSD